MTHRYLPPLRHAELLDEALTSRKTLEACVGAPVRGFVPPFNRPMHFPSRGAFSVAEVLGLPSVTFAKKITVDGSTVKVERQTEAGYDEVTCPLPALVSVTAGVVEPRYPSFKGIMAAKSKPVETVTAADLGVTPVGWAGAAQEIVDVAQAPEREAGEVIEDDGEAHLRIIALLEEQKVI